jgi:hypothetical protein
MGIVAMDVRGAAIFVCLFASGGCQSSKPSPPAKSDATAGVAPAPPPTPEAEPPKATWEDDSVSGRVLKIGNCGIEVGASGRHGRLYLDISIKGCAEGTVVSVGETKKIVKSAIFERFEAPTDFALAAAPMRAADEVEASAESGASIAVKLPRTKPRVEKIPKLKIWHAVAGALSSAADGPVKLFGETASAEKPETVAILTLSRSIAKVIGPGEKLQDIDLVAFQRSIETDRHRRCGGYDKGSAEVYYVDNEVRVFERRTGKLFQERTFKATEECPRVIYTQDGKGRHYVRDEEVELWINKLVGR